MGTSERREREKAELRQKIMDAARDMFVAEGAEAVTMRKIAARIEYSATAIYAYFPDKDTLLRALCEHDFGVMLKAGMHLMQEHDPVERMKQAGRFYIDFALEHPHQYRFMFMTPSTIEPSDPALVAYALMRDTVAQAVAAGRLRPECTDIDLLAQTLWAALHGVVALHISGRYQMIHARPPLAIAASALDCIFHGMLRKDPPKPSRVTSPAQKRRKKSARRRA
jgi:AcrR family transcriptional regulator